MNKNSGKYLARAGALLAMTATGIFGGCNYIKPMDKGALDGHKTVSHRSEAMLDKEYEKVNVDILNKRPLDIYSGERFIIRNIGENKIVDYHSRNVSPDKLKSALEGQLTGYVDSINTVPENNQILIRMINDSSTTGSSAVDYSKLEGEIKDLINSIDVSPPQIMLEMRMVRNFSDKTIDWAAFLRMDPKDISGGGLYPNILLDIPGASLRVPERAAEKGLGIQYGLIGEVGNNVLRARLDSLQSQGFVIDLARPTLTISSGERASVKLMQELPYNEAVFQGGAIYSQTRYKEVASQLEATVWARDENRVFLENTLAGVGSFNPTGVLQVPGITRREISLGGITMREGETIVIGGFRVDHALGVERREPWISQVPILGYLFPWPTDTERSMNDILFLMTPYYIDVNGGSSVIKDVPKVEEETPNVFDVPEMFKEWRY